MNTAGLASTRATEEGSQAARLGGIELQLRGDGVESSLRVEYENEELRLLAVDATYVAKGMNRDVIRAYRKTVQLIRAATDERDLYALRGLRLKQLQGDRAGRHSMRLNDQYRLIVTFKSDGERIALVIELVDYH